MPAITSRIDTRSEDFRSNAASLQQQVDDLRAKAAEIALGGDAKSVRERVTHVRWIFLRNYFDALGAGT